jgi:hypothetical protein
VATGWLRTSETGRDAAVGHVGVDEEALPAGGAEPDEAEQVAVHGEADHLHLRAELRFARRARRVVEALHRHRRAVGEPAAVHVPEPAFPQDVPRAEPVRGGLQLPQPELPHVPQPRHRRHPAALQVPPATAATLCNNSNNHVV